MEQYNQTVKNVQRKSRQQIVEAVLRDLVKPPDGSLFYEIYMLDKTATQWKQITAQGFELNVITESFLVHFRNLRDFLYPDAWVWNQNDNVLAFDYDSHWTKDETTWKECSENEHIRINKLLAHISYSRGDLARGWPVPDMRHGIIQGMSQFVSGLSPERQQYFKKLT